MVPQSLLKTSVFSPFDVVVQRLEDHHCDPRQNGAATSFTSRCPAHDDRNPSLSVTEGDDGRVLLRCFAGCTHVDVATALGLTESDLFPPSDRVASRPARTSSKPRKSGGSPKVHPTRERAIEAALWSIQQRDPTARIIALYDYQDAAGDVVLVAVRVALKDGKTFTQVSRSGTGWIARGIDDRPLYRLPVITQADRDEWIFVVEGEKDVHTCERLGLYATTSCGGSSAASKTDWRPLAGRRVCIMPDNDAAGAKYAEAVAAELLRLDPPARVRRLDLPGLPPKGDVSAWVALPDQASENPTVLGHELIELADAAPEVVIEDQAGTDWPEIESLDERPLPRFPVDALPGALREWVRAESIATQTPEDLPALLGIAACASMTAGRVDVEPRPDWREPTNVYVNCVLDPGNRKSAVFADALRPVREIEQELTERMRPIVAEAQSERRQLEKRLANLEKQASTASKEAGGAAREAKEIAVELAERIEPVMPKLVVDDATPEALAVILAEQGGRVASMSPEGGVFEILKGRYSKNGEANFETFLKAHAGDSIRTDRIGRASIFVDRPALTCGYAVQPDVIHGLNAQGAFRGRGLLARFVYSLPKSWVGSRRIAAPSVPEQVREDYRAMIVRLSQLRGQTVLELTLEAQADLEDWEAEIESMLGPDGRMVAFADWGSKLAGLTVRLAGILHCVEHGAAGQINRVTIGAAIEIARYAIPHAEAALGMMGAADAKLIGDCRYAMRWITRERLDTFTRRDLHAHGRARFPKATDLDPVLEELIRRGYLRVQQTDRTGAGRPPSPTFEVNPNSKNKTPETHPHNPQNSASEAIV